MEARWLSPTDYQALYEQEHAQGRYPARAYAKVLNGADVWRAEWKSDAGVCFDTRMTLRPAEFAQRNEKLTKLGYQLSHRFLLTSATGDTLVMATWTTSPVNNRCPEIID